MDLSKGETAGANRVLVLLAALMLAGALCRLYAIGGQTLEADELYTMPAAIGRHYRFQSDFRQPARPVPVGVYEELLSPGRGGGGLAAVTDVLRRNVHAPLYFYLMHYWVGWFGTSEASLRLPSAIFGVAAILVMFLLGREMFGTFEGLLSAALVALVPEQIYESATARMYSLLVLLALSSTYALVVLLKRRPSLWLYVAYGLASAAGLYTHYVYAFCFAAQSLYVWSRLAGRKEIRLPWLVTQLCVGACFAPWLLVTWSQKKTSDEALAWMSGALTGWEVVPALIAKVASLTTASGGPLGSVEQLAAFVLLLFGMRALFNSRDERPTLLLLCLWVAVPVAAILAADALKGTRAVTATRYWIEVSPALYLLIAVGARPLAKRVGPLTLVSALAALLFAANVNVAAYGIRRKPYDFKEATRYVESQIRDADNEVVLTEGAAAIPLALAYYGRRDILVWRVNLSFDEPSEQELVEGLRALAARRAVVWLISNQADGAAKALEAAGFRPDTSQAESDAQRARRFVCCVVVLQK